MCRTEESRPFPTLISQNLHCDLGVALSKWPTVVGLSSTIVECFGTIPEGQRQQELVGPGLNPHAKQRKAVAQSLYNY